MTNTQESNEIYSRAVKVMPGGNGRTTLFVPPHPPYAVRGEGAYVYDVDGHRTIDGNNNYTALIHGHATPHVIAAAMDTARNGASFGLPTEIEVQMAEELSARFPHNPQWRFGNSGTEAVMQAIRIARAATGRDLIIRFTGSYHGTSDSVVDPAAPGIPAAMKGIVLDIPVGDSVRLEEVFARWGQQVAAVLIDLMPNRAGLRLAQEDYIERLASLASEAGALVIADEVISFRLAYGGLQSKYGFEPDLTTLGKVIGGGFPVGAVGGKPEIMAIADPRNSRSLAWGGTFSANPVTLAAGLATLETYGAPEIKILNGHGDRLRKQLAAAGVAVTGYGSLIRLWPTQNESSLWWACYKAGLQLANGGLLSLSTSMSKTDLEEVKDILVSLETFWE